MIRLLTLSFLILIIGFYSTGLQHSYTLAFLKTFGEESENYVVQISSEVDYKTFENLNYGVVIKYPNTWTYQEIDLDEALLQRDFEVVFFSPIELDDEGTLISVIIDNLGPKHMTLEEYKDQRVSNLKMDAKPEVKAISIATTKVDGRPAYCVEYMIWMLDHWDKSIDIFSIDNNQWHEISVIGTSKSILTFSNSIENIIKSVKFTSEEKIYQRTT